MLHLIANAFWKISSIYIRDSTECPEYDIECFWVSLCLQGSALPLGNYYKLTDTATLHDIWGKKIIEIKNM